MKAFDFLRKIENRYYVLVFIAVTLFFILLEMGVIATSYWRPIVLVAGFLIPGFLAKNGTYLDSPLYKQSGICSLFIVVGALFKIRHYDYQEFVFALGFGGVVVFYVIHFLRKKTKNHIDYLKVIWLGSLMLSMFLYFSKYELGIEIPFYTSPVLFMILVMEIVRFHMKISVNWLRK